MLPDIPGIPVEGEYLSYLRRRTSELFGMQVPSHKDPKFPGAQPVSFNSSHLAELEQECYFVSEKADGIRCLFVTVQHPRTGLTESFLVDRKNSYYYLDLPLPRPDNIRQNQKDTVLDGELVLDIDKDGQRILWFLLFDCVVINGENIMEKTFGKRLGRLKDFVIKPYKQLYREDPSYAKKLPFRMDVKPLELAYHVKTVFDQIPKLRHKNDGVIFTARDAPYTIGTCQKMLKWKPSEENTVDFKLDGPDPEGRFYLMLWKGGRDGHEMFGEFTLDEDMYQEWIQNPPSGKIAECRYDPNWPGEWRFSRFRDDKENANHESVYHSIMESIRDNVDAQAIIDHAPIIRDHWKQREATGHY
ncbi:mRNA capping enzyme, catalytic domain-containing protein [Chytriomyces sp. MP71]|nr:mRNA capping enzyme, catalytic domain-containing protein [Chytriomyces sp. MP71]